MGTQLLLFLKSADQYEDFGRCKHVNIQGATEFDACLDGPLMAISHDQLDHEQCGLEVRVVKKPMENQPLPEQ